ncbi:hypothetical protein, partial [Roseiarcus sp.]|uniref:hypothetical protein n=1 Tax=Roseiarcus sp. TaxID=1969460 RepID=UPI003C4EAAB2
GVAGLFDEEVNSTPERSLLGGAKIKQTVRKLAATFCTVRPRRERNGVIFSALLAHKPRISGSA